jgi:ATPase components of ABC transporters with duplicated ATPase domains
MAQAFSLEQITLTYSEKPLFKNASLSVSQAEKVGIVGANGAGKTTLLKLIAGIEKPENGVVSLKNGLTLSYLTQAPILQPNLSIVAQVLFMCGMKDSAKEYEAKAILTRLGFTDFALSCAHLSGGQQKRVALAAAILNPSDILLLDEPTNHIDIDMIEWLEAFLKKYRGALVMVTHDRYFLDSVCTRILEVGGGKIESYNANYEGYLMQKAQRDEMEAATRRKQMSLYKTELAWIQRGAQARSTKAKGRIEAFDALEENLAQAAKGSSLQIASVSSRLGKKILICEHVSKALGGKPLILDFSYTFLRDDRIGIIGANGTGKTTLLKLLMGELAPDSGTIERGETLRFGYFAQHFPKMDESVKLIDAARNVAVRVYTPDGDLTAGQMLERFLFPSHMHNQQVSRLSGGEKRRLYLLQVLLTAPNVLLLDEPTNDLDIETLTVLEDYLDTFQGTVITVTHDRYFLDRVTRRLFALEDGMLNPYEGGYEQYLLSRSEKEITAPRTAPKPREYAKPTEKKRFTFKEQRDYEAIEQTIADLENKTDEIAAEIEKNSSDYKKVETLMQQQSETEQALIEAMERYVYLQDLFESFESKN